MQLVVSSQRNSIDLEPSKESSKIKSAQRQLLPFVGARRVILDLRPPGDELFEHS